ncbi:hypothetical protein ACFU7Y_16605 [Kitasatospora sp. NPDC057542]|uniref:hypothetical protein n=1 Tax=Kitasatospora sp. NPDC057542 TaxID=3346162 RepID=UPI00369A3732
MAELFFHYEEAGRPTLLEIAEDLARRDNLPGMASRETIRRMLKGETVPMRWSTVAAVLILFSERSGLNPSGVRSRTGWGNQTVTYGEALRKLWNAALSDNENGPVFGPPGGVPYTSEPPF